MKFLLTFLLAFSTVFLSAQTSPTVRFDSINDMLAMTIPSVNSKLTAIVSGGTATGDSFRAGIFAYNAASTASTNEYSIFKPLSTTGRWIRISGATWNQTPNITNPSEEPSYAFQMTRGVGTNALHMGATATNAIIQTFSSLPLFINPVGANNVVFNQLGGNVGIGALPTTKLTVDGDLTFVGPQTVTTTTGNLTLTTSSGSGYIDLTPNESGAVRVAFAAGGARGIALGTASPSDGWPIRIGGDINNVQPVENYNANAGSSAVASFRAKTDAGTFYIAATSLAHSGVPGAAYLSCDSTFNRMVINPVGATNLLDIWQNNGQSARFSSAKNLLIGTIDDTGLTSGGGLRVASTTAASTSIAGAAVFGNLTAATSVAIGGGNVVAGGKVATTGATTTLAAAATTLAVAGNYVILTGDAGANTLATITGGISGMVLVIQFQDALVTITDDNTGAANTVNLSAAWTSTANDTLTLISNGTSWREMARSVN